MTTDNERNNILKKIKKCLALSKSSNASEAAIALKQAKKLLEANKITMDEVYADEIKTIRIKFRSKNPNKDSQSLILALLRVFPCKAAIRPISSRESHVVIFGDSISTELFVYAYDVLVKQLKKDLKKNINPIKYQEGMTPSKLRKARKIYKIGWTNGIAEKCNALIPSEEENAQRARINDHTKSIIRKNEAKEPKPISLNSEELKIAKAGYADGEKVNLHHAAKFKPREIEYKD